MVVRGVVFSKCLPIEYVYVRIWTVMYVIVQRGAQNTCACSLSTRYKCLNGWCGASVYLGELELKYVVSTDIFG